MIRRLLPVGAALAGAYLTTVASCSLGEGTGEVKSDKLFAHDCWGEIDGGTSEELAYDLKPDFFAAIPYRSTLQIRVQRGNDLKEVSDGLTILIDDVPKIRAQLAKARELFDQSGGAPDAGSTNGMTSSSASGAQACGVSHTSSGIHSDGTVTFQVALPAGVTPPGSPAVPPPDLLADPPIVHMALYLHRSCHNQNTVLYAVSGTITFSALFSGDPNETSAAEKLIEVTGFDIQVGDLRDVPLGQYPRQIPCKLQSNVRGRFRFYFDRGQPAQPFP